MSNWTQKPLPQQFLDLWREHNPDVDPPRGFQNPNHLTAMVGREPVDQNNEDWRWHISVRFGDPGIDGRVPTWDELVDVAHELRPGVCFAIGIPPRSWWMNVHPDVLHLYEMKDEALVSQWREQRMGQTPT